MTGINVTNHTTRTIKNYSRILIASIFIFTLLLSQSAIQKVFADTSACPAGMSQVDCSAIYGPWVDWVASGATCPLDGTSSLSGGTIGSGSNIYMIGDSITNMAASNYKITFGDKGIDTFIDAEDGRSWNDSINGATSSQGTRGAGKDVVDIDKAKIQSADGIVIALGTNNGLGGNPIDDIISKIQSINSEAPVWWINTAGVERQALSGLGNFNKALDNKSKNQYTVINWAKTVDPDGDPYKQPGSDPNGLITHANQYVHPTSKGVNKLVNLVVDTLTSSGGTGGVVYPKKNGYTVVPSKSTEDSDGNAMIIYKYLLGKGLTPTQAAGVLGNLKQESGFRADAINSSSKAYGIMQWLGPRKDRLYADMQKAGIENLFMKHPNNASDAGKVLGVELDYMWWELSVGTGGNGYWLKQVKEQSSLEDVVKYWLIAIEDPFGHEPTPAELKEEMDNRLPFAQGWLKKYGGGSGVTVEDAVTCGTENSTDSSDSSTAGANGYDLSGPNKMIYYSQNDPRWASIKYGNSSWCNPYGGPDGGGCGPTSMAMIVATLTGNKDITPPVIGDFAFKTGNRVCNNGTEHTLPAAAADKYGLKSRKIVENAGGVSNSDLDKAADIIRGGGLIWAGFKAGTFTTSGHIMVLRKVSDDGQKFYIADPLGLTRTDHTTGAKTNEKAYTRDELRGSGGLWYMYAMWKP